MLSPPPQTSVCLSPSSSPSLCSVCLSYSRCLPSLSQADYCHSCVSSVRRQRSDRWTVCPRCVSVCVSPACVSVCVPGAGQCHGGAFPRLTEHVWGTEREGGRATVTLGVIVQQIHFLPPEKGPSEDWGFEPGRRLAAAAQGGSASSHGVGRCDGIGSVRPPISA